MKVCPNCKDQSVVLYEGTIQPCYCAANSFYRNAIMYFRMPAKAIDIINQRHKLLQNTKNYIKETLKLKNAQSAFLYGPTGTGKTHAAITSLLYSAYRKLGPKPILHVDSPEYANSTNVQDYRIEFSPVQNYGCYISLPEYMRKLKNSFYNENQMNDVVNPPRWAEVLIIDEFGRALRSDFDREHIFELIDYRYSRNLPCIITSNYSPEELMEFDAALLSRIVGMSKFIMHFGGEDIRMSSAAS